MGCGGGTGPDKNPAESVATVVIGNVPTAPLLVGGTVQLSATAINATGGTIAGVNFTWATSDPSRASVSSGGLVTALDAGTVAIRATAGGKTGEANLDLRAGGGLGPAGGVLTMLNGAVQLEIPAGRLGQTVNFLVRPTSDPTQNPRIVPGTVFELAPEGVQFGGGTLTIKYDPSKIPAGLVEASLQLYSFSAGVWSQVIGSTVVVSNHEARGLIGSTGTYAIASTAVDKISLTGSSVDGALYSGQATQLTANLFDVYGASLTGRPVTWSSSDNAKATVTNGLVTAVGVGSVTITAAADGKSAQSTLVILTRPVADWSQAREWTTHQGDSTHRGYFAATVDPTVFAERWVKPLAQSSLNAVAVAPGSVFVTPNSYFANQKVWALDPSNGQQRWVADFGSIHGVHPPVFADGTLYFTTSGHQDSYLYALDPATGAQRFRSAYDNQWSRWLAPVVFGGRVYMAGGYYGGMYSFDATDGTQKWFANTGQFDGWTPAVANGVAYAYGPGTPGKLMAFDAATGAPRFEIPDPNAVYFIYDLGISPVLGGPAEAFITHNGRLTSFDLGAQSIRWQKTAEFTGNVALANGVAYIINGGQLEARAPGDGSVLWSWKPVGQKLLANAVVTNNVIFVKSDARVYAVDLAAKREVWSYPATGELTPSAQGYLFIAGTDGSLRAIAIR